MAEYSPMMQHYLQTKEEYPDCILFYRLGDFYEMFFEGRTDETGNGSISMEPDMLRPMMQQIIREEVRKVLEGQDVSKINREMPTEVDLMEEEPLRMDQTMRQNVVDAISAFRRA